jgi:hypothetical protein
MVMDKDTFDMLCAAVEYLRMVKRNDLAEAVDSAILLIAKSPNALEKARKDRPADKELDDMLALADMFGIKLTDRDNAVQVYKDLFAASADTSGETWQIEEGQRKGSRVGIAITISHVIERWRLKNFNAGRSVWDA